MSRSLGHELPSEVVAGLARSSDTRDQALILATVDEGLYPRLALVSLAEVAVVDPHRLLVALWAGSNTVANLERAGVATLLWIGQKAAYSVLLRHEEATVPLAGTSPPLVAVSALVEEVRRDEVGYAILTSAITFELANPNDVLPKWQDLGERLAALTRERSGNPPEPGCE